MDEVLETVTLLVVFDDRSAFVQRKVCADGDEIDDKDRGEHVC